MRKSPAFFLSSMLCLAAVPAFADGIGTSVSGSMLINGVPPNYFQSSLGFVPAGYGNSNGSTTVTIGSGIEFGYMDGANTNTADFTGTTLTVTDVTAAGSYSVPINFVFTDPAFTGFTLLSNTLGATYSFSGTTLTIMDPAIASGGTRSVTFSYTTGAAAAATPEPGSLVLLGTGVLGVAGALRRRILS